MHKKLRDQVKILKRENPHKKQSQGKFYLTNAAHKFFFELMGSNITCKIVDFRGIESGSAIQSGSAVVDQK